MKFPAAHRTGSRPIAFGLLTSVLLVCLLPRADAETAYSALRVIGKRLGPETLERVTHVQGSKGVWKITVADPEAPGAIRKIRVRDARILTDNSAAEPAPGGPPIPLDQLNLDSDGVLATVRQQPGFQAVTADQLEYTLATSPASTTPVWTITWAEAGASKRTVMQIAANSGAVLGVATLPIADASPADPAASTPSTPRRSRRVARGNPEVLDEIAEHVDRPARLVRRILPF